MLDFSCRSIPGKTDTGAGQTSPLTQKSQAAALKGRSAHRQQMIGDISQSQFRIAHETYRDTARTPYIRLLIRVCTLGDGFIHIR
jgi:hypothetical protein